MTKGVILQQRKKPLTVSEEGNSSTCTKAGRWKIRDNLARCWAQSGYCGPKLLLHGCDNLIDFPSTDWLPSTQVVTQVKTQREHARKISAWHKNGFITWNEGYESVKWSIFCFNTLPINKTFPNANFWARVKQSQLFRSHQLRDEEQGVMRGTIHHIPQGKQGRSTWTIRGRTGPRGPDA